MTVSLVSCAAQGEEDHDSDEKDDTGDRDNNEMLYTGKHIG